jgi:hypothetical protein
MKFRIENSVLRTFSYAEEGLISSEFVGEGRLIPVLVLDVGSNQDIIDLIEMHSSITSGDVTIVWIQDLYNRKDFILRIMFSKPMQISFGVRFKISEDFALIDGIIQSKGVYLQTGKKGDKVSKKLNDNKILVEVPDTGIKSIWTQMLNKTLISKYRKMGFNRKEAKEVTQDHIAKMRELWKIRKNK